MDEIGIEEIHRESLEILKKIISICEYLKINYYLAYGSLIGAVRHSGFIPWDDDLDVVMLRDDYEIFLNYCQQNQEKIYPYKLLCREYTRNYPYNIARLNDFRYKAVYDNVQKYDSGLFVDIYPLDDVGNLTQKEIVKLDKKRSHFMKMILWSIDDHYEKSKHGGTIRSFIKYFVRLYAKLKGSKYFLDKMESFKEQYSIDGSRYVAEMTWDPKTILCEKKWFDGYTNIKFEGLEVKAPRDIDAFLKAYYGDYMKLPPVEERKPSHCYRLYKREDRSGE